MSMKVEGLMGETAPCGYFDPIGLSKGKSLKEVIFDFTTAIRNSSESQLKFRHCYQMNQFRESELKHGRVAMLASVGFMVQPWFHPLAEPLKIAHPESAIQAMYETPLLGWGQVLLVTGVFEWLSVQIQSTEGYQAGDILGVYQYTDNNDKGWADYQNRELNNGRLAMVAAMGFWIQSALYGNSGDLLFAPLRAIYEPHA